MTADGKFPITEFTPTACRAFSDSIQAALQELADRHGLVLTMRGGKYTATSYAPKIEFAVKGEDGIVLNHEARTFQQMAPYVGLQSTDLGRSFQHGGNAYTICGYASRGSKLPVLAKRPDGRIFKFAPNTVKKLLPQVV
jgi:hypothetical protein